MYSFSRIARKPVNHLVLALIADEPEAAGASGTSGMESDDHQH